MIKWYKCLDCKHFRQNEDNVVICDAFPNGIPLEIFTEKVDHTRPYKDDNGIQFEPINATAKKEIEK